MKQKGSWLGPDSEVGRFVEAQNQQSLNAYREQPDLVRRDAGIERQIAQGGYERRQLFELVQNGADAMLQAPGGRIEIVLTDDALYCANQGQPLTVDGARSILLSHISDKRGEEIGRFGVGFKSVLAVSDEPEVHSRTGSFRFDLQRSEELIRDVLPDAAEVPRLRLAFPLGPGDPHWDDPVLDRLRSWADTVVKLPLHRRADQLKQAVHGFPPEFLVFVDHVGELELVDATADIVRHIRVERRAEEETDAQSVTLHDGERTSRWRIFSTTHSPSAEARAEAGELAERDTLFLYWAVNLDDRTSRGQFWAFFPTTWQTTLRGILNAAWKTNEDRQNLLEGELNNELLSCAAALVCVHMADLSTADDPGRYLDFIPARGKAGESANWADTTLTSEVYEFAQFGPTLPDVDGEMRRPEELRMHPKGLPPEALALWAAVPARPSNWCHRTIDQRERRSRAERIFEGNRMAQLDDWLYAITELGTVEASSAAVKIAARLNDEAVADPANLRVLLTSTGDIVAPDPTRVFVGGPRGDRPANPDIHLVHPDLAADPDTLEALLRLGIRRLDPKGELEAMLARGVDHWRGEDWEAFWVHARGLTPDVVVEVLADRGVRDKVSVRSTAGVFRRLSASLLPGPVIAPDDRDHEPAAIDTRWHNPDLQLLQLLGATDRPGPGYPVTTESFFRDYRNKTVDAYLRSLKGGRPRPEYLEFAERQTVGPLEPLRHLQPESNARYTRLLLEVEGAADPWMLSHRTSDSYPRQEVQNPAIWMVAQHGVLTTSLGNASAQEAVGPALVAHNRHFPVVDGLPDSVAAQLGLPQTLEQVTPARWKSAFSRAASDDPESLGHLYALAASAGLSTPPTIACSVGDSVGERSPAEVLVTSDRAQMKTLSGAGEPHVWVAGASDADHLCSNWGLRRAETTVQVEVLTVDETTATAAVDLFPGLRLIGDLPDLEVVAAREVELAVDTAAGRSTEEVQVHAQGLRIFYAEETAPGEVLDAVLAAAEIELDAEERRAVLDFQPAKAEKDLLASVRRQKTDASRLVKAVGVEALRSRLPRGLLDAHAALKKKPLSDQAIGELALAVHGVDALHAHRVDLERRGLVPPRTWAGSREARDYVHRLGFGVEYAGFRGDKLDAVLFVDGPPDLPDLHLYQRTIADNLRALLKHRSKSRGLVSLPTGAGKTRVAVQALIEAVKEDGLEGPLLWIAQSEELCEQAVQSWHEAWRAMGPRRVLTVSRLWSSRETEARDGAHVVVATIQKLQNVVDKKDYDWLSAAGCVVIDEAHGSTETSYTKVLEWLGLGRGKDRCPLIGLTATPFRGTSERETERLANRYQRDRLDEDALGDDQYGELQELGVLAQVEHRLLSGAEFKLSGPEVAEIDRLKRLPSSVASRLGDDVGRNKEILDSIASLPDDMTVLLFSASVDHAQTMAALLSDAGIAARPISATTDVRARRHYVEEFRAGRLRVLTNYGVLTQGFDAPAVGAVYVTRPTFSPNVYQQMIGRGLRGPLNGGKETCLIVNVEDNLEQYGTALAFREFEYLWSDE